MWSCWDISEIKRQVAHTGIILRNYAEFYDNLSMWIWEFRQKVIVRVMIHALVVLTTIYKLRARQGQRR